MQPVEYVGAAAKVVADFAALPENEKVAAHWSRDDVGPARKIIKDHYIKEQERRCCYCRTKQDTANNAVWDGEHVIARDNRPEFMFEPRNLAIACKDCNIAKGAQEVLRNPARKSFADKSEHYLIVHPHFDDYDDHLLWFGPLVAPAGTGSDKGTNTINMCKLHRYAANCAGLTRDVGDQRYRDRIGELMINRKQTLAREIIGELEVQIGKLEAD